MDDGHHLKPAEVYSYLTRVIYNRRNKYVYKIFIYHRLHNRKQKLNLIFLFFFSRRMDPLWNSLVVGGFYDNKPFLGTIGMIGTNYTDVTVATGFGNHLARPLMRERHRPDMSEEEAVELLKDCLRVCYYRDKNSINKFTLAKVTKDGVSISEPFALETRWDYKLFKDPSANAVGTW